MCLRMIVIDRIRVDILPSHVTASPCLVRDLFASAYPVGRYGVRGVVVSSRRSSSAAGTSGGSHPLGT